MSKMMPLRMCIACRQMKPKEQLFRIVKQEDKIFVDNSYKANGRGAYVCKEQDCVQKAIKTKALNRTFKKEVGQDVLSQIQQTLKK